MSYIKARKLRWLGLVCIAALLSLGCGTFTIATNVIRDADGNNNVGMNLGIDINSDIFAILKEENPGFESGMVQNLSSKGWKVTTADGGRITNAVREPVGLLSLRSQGWNIVTDGTGKISTLILDVEKVLGYDPKADSGVKSVQLVIDETDPANPHYNYRAILVIKPPEQVSDSVKVADNVIEIDLSKSPEFVRLDNAMKNAGPPKMVFSVTLPGTIDPPLLNGEPGGVVQERTVYWTLDGNRVGTYTMEANSAGTSDSAAPGDFTVGGGCTLRDPGAVTCVAATSGARPDAEIVFEWTLDGQTQAGQTGRTLNLTDLKDGDYTVTVRARDTVNNVATRAEVFSVKVGEGGGNASSNPRGPFTASMGCTVDDVDDTIVCNATAANAPSNAELRYYWLDNTTPLSDHSKTAIISNAPNGIHLISVSIQDAKSGKKTGLASTTVVIGNPAMEAGVVLLTGKTDPELPEIVDAAQASAAVAVGVGIAAIANGISASFGGGRVVKIPKILTDSDKSGSFMRVAPVLTKPSSVPESKLGGAQIPRPVNPDPPPKPLVSPESALRDAAGAAVAGAAARGASSVGHSAPGGTMRDPGASPETRGMHNKTSSAPESRREAGDTVRDAQGTGQSETATPSGSSTGSRGAEFFDTSTARDAASNPQAAGQSDTTTTSRAPTGTSPSGSTSASTGHATTASDASGTSHADASTTSTASSGSGSSDSSGAATGHSATGDVSGIGHSTPSTPTSASSAGTGSAAPTTPGTSPDVARDASGVSTTSSAPRQNLAASPESSGGSGAGQWNVASNTPKGIPGGAPAADALGELAELRLALRDAETRHQAAAAQWDTIAAQYTDETARDNVPEWKLLQDAEADLKSARDDLRNFVLLHPTLFVGG